MSAITVSLYTIAFLGDSERQYFVAVVFPVYFLIYFYNKQWEELVEICTAEELIES